MNKELRRLITESRSLLRVASPQQKLRLLKLLKESLAMSTQTNKTAQTKLPENVDYIEEK